jgi:hypothetical protein
MVSRSQKEVGSALEDTAMVSGLYFFFEPLTDTHIIRRGKRSLPNPTAKQV